MNGHLIISLDFELHWGVSENLGVAEYSENLGNTRMVVEKLLRLFSEYEIEATWATVGFMFFENNKALIEWVSTQEFSPPYSNKKLDNFALLKQIKDEEEQYYFARDLIQKITQTQGQELATHTFSHLYTLEGGVTLDHFRTDLEMAIEVAKFENYTLESIVFPRNQYNTESLQACKTLGIHSFRGNPAHWIYRPSIRQGIAKRVLRLLDSYTNITGHHEFALNFEGGMLNLPASRFLRPYNRKLFFLEKQKARRITEGMTRAARHNLNYHLWWHPHNFGACMEENFEVLSIILDHHKYLEREYGFKSRNMRSLYKNATNTLL